MVNHNTTADARFCCTLWSLCSSISKHGCCLGSARTFTHGRWYDFYKTHSKQRNYLSIYGTWTPQIVLPTPGIWSTSSLVHHQAWSSETPDSVLHCLQNPGGIETLSFLLSMIWGNRFIFPSPENVFTLSGGMLFFHDPNALHCPPFLFLSSLSEHSSCSTEGFFCLPHFTSLPSTCQTLWLKLCRFLHSSSD